VANLSRESHLPGTDEQASEPKTARRDLTATASCLDGKDVRNFD